MDKLLLEYPWLPKIVSLAKDHGLDWLMMACLALELSNGDPRCRTLDHSFLINELGESATDLAVHDQWVKVPTGIDEEVGLAPEVAIYDRATRWGLFQILGEVAIGRGIFTGRMINFTDIGANTRAACLLAQDIINKGGTLNDIINYFGADPVRVLRLMDESRRSIMLLLDLTHVATSEEELEQA